MNCDIEGKEEPKTDLEKKEDFRDDFCGSGGVGG